MKYIKFLFASHKAYTVIAEMKEVKNPNHKNFGKWSIGADMQYNPLHEIISGNKYMSKEECQDLLTKLGFVEVKSDFDLYSESDLMEIESKMPENWTNSFLNF